MAALVSRTFFIQWEEVETRLLIFVYVSDWQQLKKHAGAQEKDAL